MAEGLVERLKAQRGRTEQELEALGEGMASKPPPPKKAPVRKPPVEKAGTGRSLVDETTRALITGMDARINAFRKAGNKAKVAELEARKKALLEEAALAKK